MAGMLDQIDSVASPLPGEMIVEALAVKAQDRTRSLPAPPVMRILAITELPSQVRQGQLPQGSEVG